MRKEETMKRIISILVALALVLGFSLVVTVPAVARNNTTASGTMVFNGTLTAAGGGVYTGTIPMVQESVAAKGDGEDGFDLYARQGGCAYCQGYYGTGAWNCAGADTYAVGYYSGNDQDAYPSPGGPWGTWYDPDCADWQYYALELTADHWYLRYTSTNESPMSGVMYWYGDGTGYAKETDKGTDDTTADKTDPVGYPYAAGSAQEWGWNCGWGEERIPLQYPGFHVSVTAGGSYVVTLTPAAGTNTQTGTGTASFSTNAGVIEGLTPVAEGTLPTAGKPNLVFPHGFFSFNITGLTLGQTVTVTITLPSAVPVGTQYWKYGPTVANPTPHWYQVPMGDNDGDNVIMITLQDGGLGDDDLNANGVIVDQGAPGNPGAVGWETYPISKVRVLLPWIALGAAILAGASLLVLRRRRAQS
jgi:hypothetical protein